MQFYEIHTDKYIFYATVDRQDDRHIMQIGSSKMKDCMTIHLFGTDAELRGMMYNRLCASNLPLAKKHGTLEMGKAGLAAALQLFPKIRYFHLTDNSQIECGKAKVSLSDMSFLIHRQTWYERHFHATPLFQLEYTKLRKEFEQKPHFDFDDLWDQYLDEGAEAKYLQQEKTWYHQQYDLATSWFEFFKMIYEKEGCRPFIFLCNLDVPIIAVITEEFLKTLHGKEWVIPKKVIQEDQVHVRILPLSQSNFPTTISWSQQDDTLRTQGGAMIFPADVCF